MNRNRYPTSWFLATVIDGLLHASLRTGRHVYVSRTPDGRYLVLGQKDVTMILTEPVACRRLRRDRDRAGKLVRVANQAKQWARFAEARARGIEA